MGRLENDCVVLLCYLADNPDAPQDLRYMSEQTGIPKTRLYEMIYYPWKSKFPQNFYYWALEKYAEKYGFEFRVLHGEDKKHISVVRVLK